MPVPEPDMVISGATTSDAGEISSQSGSTGGVRLTEFLHNKRVMGGVWVIVAIGIFCFIGPLIYRTNQTTVELNIINQPPGHGHPLGTDVYGIDVLGRLMVGGQSSLELGFAVAIASTVIGALYGAISGSIGGVLDAVLMRIVDTVLAVPTFILLIILASLYSLSLGTIILVLTVLSWPYAARLVRAEVLSLREREFVQASKAMGAGRRRILFTHLIPNTLNIFIVTSAFAVADSIYALSALSFLGLGPQPPFADWGTLVTTGASNLFNGFWWQVYPPLFMLVLTVLAFRQIGDACNDVISGQHGGRRVRPRRRTLLSMLPMGSRPEPVED